MTVMVRIAAAAVVLAATSSAHAGERDQLNACRDMIARVAQSQPTPDTPEIARCRQIIKEWTLRDSRMSVDEQGKPLR
ncbi:hypothetical protein ACFFWD_14540 [Bradyrhizobium erythrophlei]|uniref:hypothetical protein n=1 Tax=Bradyrhizobium erythrophlei TaxID=1437360 RepID=UPI0035E7A89C